MSILFTPEELEGLQDKVHAYNYFDTKQNEMQNFAEKVEADSSIITGIRNAKLSFLMNNYNDAFSQYDRKVKEQQRNLNPDQFQSIFQDQYVYQQKDETKEIENEREKYFQQFVENPRKMEERQVLMISVLDKIVEQPETQIQMKDQVKWIKQYKKEVQEILRETQNLQKKASNSVMCKNIKLIKQMAPTIYAAYNTYFEEIFTLLMDDILTEEVLFLNKMEDENYQNLQGGQKVSPEKQKEIEVKQKARDMVIEREIPATMLNLLNQFDEYTDLENNYYY